MSSFELLYGNITEKEKGQNETGNGVWTRDLSGGFIWKTWVR